MDSGANEGEQVYCIKIWVFLTSFRFLALQDDIKSTTAAFGDGEIRPFSTLGSRNSGNKRCAGTLMLLEGLPQLFSAAGPRYVMG